MKHRYSRDWNEATEGTETNKSVTKEPRPTPQELQQQETKNNTRKYNKGDRIVITNRIKKPVNWKGDWSATKERHGTVTLATTEKVFFRTDNGVFTWRAPKNIVHQTTR